MQIVIGVHTPEQGWQPAIDWCISQGLDPSLVRQIVLTGEGTAEVIISIRSTDDLDVWTAIGMLRGALVDLEHQFLDSMQ